LLRFMPLSFAYGPSWTAYFRFATAGFPLPEDFVPPWRAWFRDVAEKCGHNGTRVR
jgi:hypothetical protein